LICRVARAGASRQQNVAPRKGSFPKMPHDGGRPCQRHIRGGSPLPLQVLNRTARVSAAAPTIAFIGTWTAVVRGRIDRASVGSIRVVSWITGVISAWVTGVVAARVVVSAGRVASVGDATTQRGRQQQCAERDQVACGHCEFHVSHDTNNGAQQAEAAGSENTQGLLFRAEECRRQTAHRYNPTLPSGAVGEHFPDKGHPRTFGAYWRRVPKSRGSPWATPATRHVRRTALTGSAPHRFRRTNNEDCAGCPAP
jgi:hypothetical protein